MVEITNRDRAKWARAAAQAYREARGTDEDDITEGQDLLCDLAHMFAEDIANDETVASVYQDALFHFYREHYNVEPVSNNTVQVTIEQP